MDDGFAKSCPGPLLAMGYPMLGDVFAGTYMPEDVEISLQPAGYVLVQIKQGHQRREPESNQTGSGCLALKNSHQYVHSLILMGTGQKGEPWAAGR